MSHALFTPQFPHCFVVLRDLAFLTMSCQPSIYMPCGVNNVYILFQGESLLAPKELCLHGCEIDLCRPIKPDATCDVLNKHNQAFIFSHRSGTEFLYIDDRSTTKVLRIVCALVQYILYVNN